MKRNEFMEAVRKKLKGLSEEDINKALEFYDEIINDKVEDGVPEDEAVDALGTPDEIAEQIMMGMSLPKLVKAKAKPTGGFKAWEIVLIILGFPIWFSLLVAAASVVFAFFIVILSLVIAFFAVVISFGFGGLVLIAAGFMSLITGGGVSAIYQLGVALMLIGLAVLLFTPAKAMALWMVEMCKKFGRWVKLKVINMRKKGE